MHTRVDVFPEVIDLAAKQKKKAEWRDNWLEIHARGRKVGTMKPTQTGPAEKKLRLSY